MPSDSIPKDQFLEGHFLSDLLCTPEKIDRVAELVAQGEFPIPSDLDADQINLLVGEVRKRRRRRLVQHIAQAFALEIWWKAEQSNDNGDSNDTTAI